MPCKGRFSGWLKVIIHPGLYDISKSAAEEAGASELWVSVNRQEYEFRLAAGFLQSLHCLDAIEKGHRNVCDNDIRLQFFCSLD